MELAAADECSNRAAAAAPHRWGRGLGGVAPAVLAVLVLVLVMALGSLAAAPVAGPQERAAAPAAANPGSGGAGTGSGGSGGKSEAAPDPVVQEVLRMLQAKVAEPVIVHWLDTTGRRPAEVGSREIVELRRAGASDALMTKLLDLAAAAPAAAGAASGPGAAERAPMGGAAGPGAAERAPTGAAAGPGASERVPMGAAAGPGAAERAPAGAAQMHWRIAYHPYFGADDERWDLYVYLDGRYLAAVKSPVVSFLDPPLEFDRSLAPGHHVLRVAEERHLRRFGREGWTHAAKVAPAALAFDVAPDAAGRVDLQCERRERGGPVSLVVTQGDTGVARAQPAIGQPDAWPWLCEEAAAGKPARRRQAAASAPGSCLHWADLWPGVEAPPSRDAVRTDLERQGFRPDPARQ